MQDTSVLAEDVMVLAALLSLASREDLTYSLSRQLLLRAVRALVRAPTAQLDRGHVAGGVLAWSWVCSAIPKLVQVDVVAEVAGFLRQVEKACRTHNFVVP